MSQFQVNLARALASTAESKGIVQTATDFASAIESRIGSGQEMVGIHAAILAVVGMAARSAKPMPISQEAAAELLVNHAALQGKVEALEAALAAQAKPAEPVALPAPTPPAQGDSVS